jgi:hypothetical protein
MSGLRKRSIRQTSAGGALFRRDSVVATTTEVDLTLNRAFDVGAHGVRDG